MKTTLDLRPDALRAVKSVSRRENISLDEAASVLILQAAAGTGARVKLRHGIPMARNDGVTMTSGEVAATLNDE